MTKNNVYLASKPRYEILDGLRGVAAMLVVAYHCLRPIMAANLTSPLITAIWLWISSLCCPASLSAMHTMTAGDPPLTPPLKGGERIVLPFGLSLNED